MKFAKNAKGQMRVIETILASLIIIGALSFVSTFAVNPKSLGFEMTDLEKMGYSALHDLDQQGLLAKLVYAGKWGDLKTILKMTVPNDVYFNLTICDIEGLKLNTFPILYGDAETFSEAGNVASLTYCLAGETTYEPRILILQITRG